MYVSRKISYEALEMFYSPASPYVSPKARIYSLKRTITMLLFTAVVCFVLFTFSCLYLYFAKPLNPTTSYCGAPRYISNSTYARSLLANSSLDSRAIPNQRLVLAFGIDNAFTTVDANFHKYFVSKVKGLLRTQDEEWRVIAERAANNLTRYTALTPPSGLISLETSIQLLVFRAVLGKFFAHLHQTSSDSDIEYITTTINILWIASKNPNDQEHLEHEKDVFLRKLESVLKCDVAAENPLNIIIPAYETLWRVVLRCFVEIRFRSSPTSRLCCTTLLSKFSSHPTHTSLKARSGDYISVKDIALEALRLYPPTRRMYRYADNNSTAIDIEHVHRDYAIWGHDADQFNPSRIRNMNRQAFIAFGTGKFACPAETLFGPMMISILVGALVAEFDERFALVDFDGNEVDLGDGPLDNGRGAYGFLNLTKVVA